MHDLSSTLFLQAPPLYTETGGIYNPTWLRLKSFKDLDLDPHKNLAIKSNATVQAMEAYETYQTPLSRYLTLHSFNFYPDSHLR
jgi:hypothetical protein